MFLRELMCLRKIKHYELTKVLKTDKAYISRLMNYKFLPTPEDAKKICKFLNCDILEIYDEKEINIKSGARQRETRENDNKYYRLSVRLKLGGCNLLQQTKKLKQLGYKSKADWVRKKIKETEQEYKNYLKQKRLTAHPEKVTESHITQKSIGK